MAVSVNIEKNFRDFSLKVQFEGSSAAIGLLGASGSGKSMTLRCIAGIETPDRGKIVINGKTVFDSEAGINLKPQKRQIGYLFQNYALFPNMNVFDNVAYGLKVKKVPKTEIKERVTEMLKLVQLEGFGKRRITQMSGGQKQRVAIARALANNPDILLCDEATSALDPQTTQSILELLQQINHDYGITIVLITHEMSVVQKICNKVAILEKGHLVETGSVSKIFANPESAVAKKMIFGEDTSVPKMEGKHLVRIVFSENSSFEPVIGNMILRYKTPVNILHADTKDINGIATGEMILQLPEDEDIAKQMITYLRDCKLTVKEVEADVSL